ncbi:hypothetical protein D8S78_07450 [Natrialba swarupiae]|nr:hypothetical protein [Natrialba swarupiae]
MTELFTDDRPDAPAETYDKTTTLEDAIADYVTDGSSVAFGGMGGRDPRRPLARSSARKRRA